MAEVLPDSDDEPDLEVPTIPSMASISARLSADASEVGDKEEDETTGGALSQVRLFGSPSFFRLWLAQVASSLGDWIGFLAITAYAARIAGGSPETAVGLVLSARLVPGFFLAPVAGVLVDRLDRRKTMVVCDIGRGILLATLPWVHTVRGLVILSLFLEILTLLWSPAKEASVPRLVPTKYLATANSLSLVAAYGTLPVGSAMFTLLAGVAKFLGRYPALAGLKVDQEFVAVFFDAGTFFVSAILISTLVLPGARSRVEANGTRRRVNFDFGRAWRELREGFAFIGHSRVVRAVILSLATGLVGGGMLVPLGPTFARETLHGGSAAYGLLLTSLGVGVAAGIVGLSIIQRRLPHERVFLIAVFGAGVSIIAGASMGDLRFALVFVALLGVCAGAVYVLGFTILQTNVADEMRGRIFATLYTVVRFCLLLAFAAAPFLSTLLADLSHSLLGGAVTVLGLRVSLSGARLTLWLGGLIILGAGFVALFALRDRE